MRRAILFVLGFITLQATGLAQSTLVFPKVFSVAELKTTGFAIVNPVNTSAIVTISLYKPNPVTTGNTFPSTIGELISGASWTVPAKGQFSKLGSEVFPGASAPGWVEITSPTAGLQGFWLGGDFATSADGADAAQSSTDLVFPIAVATAEINITNVDHSLPATYSSVRTVTLRLLSASGGDVVPPVSRVIEPRGAFQSNVSDLFPGADFSQALYIRVSCGTKMSGTEVVRGFLVNAETAVLNAIDGALAGSQLNFVHSVSGPAGNANYTTVIGVINLGTEAQTVTITFNPEPRGTPVVVKRTLPPNGALRENAKDLFGFTPDFQNGWIRVAGSSPITGFSAYADIVSGGLAAVPVQTQPLSTMMFDQIAGPPTWYTGIALLNSTTTDAQVEVYALTPGGTLIGGAANTPTAAFTLPAGHKVAKLLSELIPATASENNGFVYVRTTNSVPLYGIELFGGNVLPILSNVAASPIYSSVVYTPPSPTEPLVINSVNPVRAVRGSTITLNGDGFGYPASKNTISFTTNTGTIQVAATDSTLNTLAVVVPATAITGPIFVRTGGRDSSAAVVEITASATTLIQNPVAVAEGQATQSVDIYVPKAAGVLTLLAIGITPVSAKDVTFDAPSVDLARGDTRWLIIAGLGLNPGTSYNVTVSGSGITIFDTAPINNGLIVTIKADPAAETGPRTVFVSNTSTFDISAIPGGIYIR